MKHISNFQPLVRIALVSFIFQAGNAFAQYAVNDAGTQVAIANLTSQQASNQASILQQWATSFSKLDSQINQLSSLVQVAGNPQAALRAIGGTANLGSIGTTLSQVGQLGNQILSTANGVRSLGYTAQGAFQSIPNSLSNGSIIPRNSAAYNKFDAYEQNFSQLNSTLQQCQSTRQNLLAELQNALGVTPADAPSQQAQLIKINAINGQLLANDQLMKQVQSQTTAQSEANIQDTEKQREALSEQIYAQDQQTSSQAAAYSKTILNNR
jgi:hypothetical protein